MKNEKGEKCCAPMRYNANGIANASHAEKHVRDVHKEEWRVYEKEKLSRKKGDTTSQKQQTKITKFSGEKYNPTHNK